MTEFPFPWLQLAVAIPLVGALVVWRLRDSSRAQVWSVVCSAASFLAAIGAWQNFRLLGATEAADSWDLLAQALHRPVLVLDELSAPLLPLVALVYVLTAVLTLRTKQRRFSFSSMLVSQALVLATLACKDPGGIIGLLAVATIPPYLELKARHKPTRVYVLHMVAFVVLMVAGWVLVETQGKGGTLPIWAVAPVVIALLIRCGIAPFHCWLTDLFEHASFGTALLFAVPMVGEYAAVRLILPIAPDRVLQWLAIISLVTAVYAAGLALVQREARRFFCYIFLSHSALVLVGLESLSPIGLTGALCVWLSAALSLAGFGLTLRALEARHGRLSLTGFHGIYEHTPLLAVCFFITGMASVGFPGTFGFLGMEMLVDGAFQALPYTGIAVVATGALNGIAVVQAYFKLFTGSRHVTAVPLQVGLRERLAVITLAALIFGGALYPQPGVTSRHHAAEQLLSGREQPATASRPLVAELEAAVK